MKSKHLSYKMNGSKETADRPSRADSGDDTERVKNIFAEIAGDYERVNGIISLGQIDRWRRRLVSEMEISEGMSVLDVGCGTGKLTSLLASKLSRGRVLGIDLTPEMVDLAKKNLPPRHEDLVEYSTGAAENLDLPENSFDLVASSFTLRNVDDLAKVMSEMNRVVKPGGRVYSLELAKPAIPGFKELYRFYFNRVLPVIGGIVQGDRKPYRYLAESLRRFPDQESLKQLYEKAGMVDVRFQEILGGIAAIHQGTKREN